MEHAHAKPPLSIAVSWTYFPIYESIAPAICAHPSFRAWMGAHLPYRNTCHKGIYPFVEQTHHYAPDEIGCLFWWADHVCGHIFTSILFERSSRPPRFISRLYAFHHLCLLYHKLYCCSNFISFQSLPRSINSLRSHTSQFHHNRFWSSPHFPTPVIIIYNRHSTGIWIPVTNTKLWKHYAWMSFLFSFPTFFNS